MSSEDVVTIPKDVYLQLLAFTNKSKMDDVVLLCGRSCMQLGRSIAKSLSKPLVNVTLTKFANGELNVIINETIRSKHVFVIQTGASCNNMSINDYLIETMLILDACKRTGVESISVLIPTFFYSRSDKKDNGRVAIGAGLVMNMMQPYADRIITLDLHSSQIQAFTSGPSDNLYAINLFCEYIQKEVFYGIDDINSKFILISPDVGGDKRTNAYSKKLRLTANVLTKQRSYTEMNLVNSSTLTGDVSLVQGKTAIVPDDICDTFGTMLEGIKELKKYGIKDVIVIATHGVLSGPAIDRINNCEDVIKVIVTNSICQEENKKRCPKLVVLDLGDFFAEAITRVMTGDSLSKMFI